ncbi:MAG: type III pantothenate kinase [Bacilli bacterium]|nr:type III pantothenate kinase [Bacilli bacterium]
MRLCVDVGNTTIGLGFYQEDELITKLVLATSINKLEDEYYASIKLLIKEKGIELNEIKDILYSSVVPRINETLLPALKSLFKEASIYTLDYHSPHLIKMDIDNPKELGSDLIADLVGAKNKYPLPLVIIDFGTATKLLLISKEGVFTSALIMPGVEVAAKSLFSKAALLPEVDLNNYSNLLDSKNTVNCIKHGILFGHYESIVGLVTRYEKEIGYKLNKVVTGGSATFFKNLFDESYIFDMNLVLDGENEILKRIKEK